MTDLSPGTWDQMPRATWAIVAHSLATPWPREAVEFDLVYHHQGGRGRIPSRRKLMARWGWTDSKTRTVVRRFAEAMGLVTPTPNLPAVSQESPNDLPAVSQPGKDEASISSANLPAISQQSPSSLPAVSTGALETDIRHQTSDIRHTSNPAGSDGGSAGEGKDNTTRKDFARCADAWQAVKPGGLRPSMSKGQGQAMKARMDDHGADAVIAVIHWAADSDHDRARFLRERGLSLQTLMRPSNFEAYHDFATDENPATRRGKVVHWTFPTSSSTSKPGPRKRARRVQPGANPQAGGYVEALRRKAAAAGGDA